MNGADDAGLAHGDRGAEIGGEAGEVACGGDDGGALAEAGDKDEDSDGEEGGGDKVEAAEEEFDFGFGGAVEGGLLDELDEQLAEDAGEDGGPEEADGDALEAVGGGEVGALPLAPEVDDDGEHGAGVEHDEQQRHGGRGGVEAHELFGDDDVGGARDGQEFSEALHDGKEDDLQQDRHGVMVNGRVGLLMSGCGSWGAPLPPTLVQSIRLIAVRS